MPSITQWFIKAALIYFFLSLFGGVLIVFPAAIELSPYFLALTPVYFHTFLFGWITQMIFGVSLWMFPAAPKDHSEIPSLPWFSFGLINIGLLLRIVSEPMLALYPAEFYWKILIPLSALSQWLGGIFYVALIWKRVRGKNA